MNAIIEALEKKHPGCEVLYVHPDPHVLDSDQVKQIAEAIDLAELMDIAEALK